MQEKDHYFGTVGASGEVHKDGSIQWKEIMKEREMHAEIERTGLLDKTFFLDLPNMNKIG